MEILEFGVRVHGADSYGDHEGKDGMGHIGMILLL